MNTPEHLNIAQWVIDNRYPKSELDKISDFELYTELSDKIQAHTQSQIDKALTVAANVAEIEANEYKAKISELEKHLSHYVLSEEWFLRFGFKSIKVDNWLRNFN